MEVFTPPPYKEKRAPGRQPIHSFETRVMIGRQVSNGEFTYSKASQAYGISEGAIGVCVKLYRDQESGKKRTERKEERSEVLVEYHHQSQLKDLKQEIANLYLENQMLKKMLSHFRQHKKENGSVITPENLAESQGAAK